MVKSIAPESAVLFEPIRDGRERICLNAIVGFAALAAMPYQLGPLKHGEVLGDGGLRNTGAIGQSVDGLLAVAGEALEDCPAGGIGERSENMVREDWHAETIAKWLLIVKDKKR